MAITGRVQRQRSFPERAIPTPDLALREIEEKGKGDAMHSTSSQLMDTRVQDDLVLSA